MADDLEAARTYWESQARQKANTLKGWLKDDYPVFEEMIFFPGDQFNRMSWQDIYNRVDAWVKCGKDVVLANLECTCRPDRDACPVCAAKARMRGGA